MRFIWYCSILNWYHNQSSVYKDSVCEMLCNMHAGGISKLDKADTRRSTKMDHRIFWEKMHFLDFSKKTKQRYIFPLTFASSWRACLVKPQPTLFYRAASDAKKARSPCLAMQRLLCSRVILEVLFSLVFVCFPLRSSKLLVLFNDPHSSLLLLSSTLFFKSCQNCNRAVDSGGFSSLFFL